MQDFLWNAFYRHPVIATGVSIVVIAAVLLVIVRLWYARKMRLEKPMEEFKQSLRLLAFRELVQEENVFSFSVSVDKSASHLEVVCLGLPEAIVSAEAAIRRSLAAIAPTVTLAVYDMNDPSTRSLPTFGMHLLTHQAAQHSEGCECGEEHALLAGA